VRTQSDRLPDVRLRSRLRTNAREPTPALDLVEKVTSVPTQSEPFQNVRWCSRLQAWEAVPGRALEWVQEKALVTTQSERPQLRQECSTTAWAPVTSASGPSEVCFCSVGKSSRAEQVSG
jgi:hypothetical protein